MKIYLGVVIGFKNNRQLKIDTSSGYSRVILQNNGKKERFLVHRLVAIHFVDGYFDGAVHRDKYLDYNNLPHTRSL